MKANPFAYATFAALYIVIVVNVMNFMMSITKEGSGDGILVPMAVLSLFVLSAAVMGYLFVFEPVRLYLEGKKSDGISFFLKTVGTFACFVAFFIAALLYTAAY